MDTVFWSLEKEAGELGLQGQHPTKLQNTLTKEQVGVRNHRMFRDRQEMWLEKIQR